MAPKTRAELQRDHRERKKQEVGVAKKPRKKRGEIRRDYRERKKLEDDKTYLQRERDRKRKAYIPTALLTESEAIVQMDFAENYTCQSLEEVQSAYWNASMVTLHPAIAYYRSEDGQVSYKSRVFISDELGHNSATVFAFIKELIPHLKVMLSQVKRILYYTDSPTSQYRNKTIFYLLSHHKELFRVSASRDFFEAGHGKGPCDGIGGSVKHMADEAVRLQKVTIQGASDSSLGRSNTRLQALFLSPLFPRRIVSCLVLWQLNQKLRDLES